MLRRLRSTETLGSTSAINSDKTGTLTLNQMTAVELALVGRRFSITGVGYGTEGRITRTAGLDDVQLEQFLMPMALASDAYPVMGATPVPYKQPASDKNGVMVTGVRVGSYTIKDAEGMLIESLPIDWHMLHTPHLQALRETADAIAARVAAIGS